VTHTRLLPKSANVNPGVFLSKKKNCTKVQIFVRKCHAKKKCSATMQHSARTSFHVTWF